MKNALIFSSSFSGHRQVYVFVLTHIIHKLGYKLFIAGNFSEKLNNTYYIDKLSGYENIVRIDTTAYKGNGIHITNEEFRLLQKENNIELTVFAEADNHIQLINSQLLNRKKKFQGRVVAIFLRPFYFYHKIKLIEKYWFVKSFTSRWEKDARFFHELLNPHFKLLDVSLYIDDFFVSRHKNTKWLPDVFQQYADQLVLFEEHPGQRIWMKRLDAFRSANVGRFFVLYFGTAQKRRGYDQLLKLAVKHNMCFIHCGLRNADSQYEINVDELRHELGSSNRLFETNEYITDPTCIEYFFKSVSHLILPYNNFFGSSGVMLQALGYNIPVLVPDEGIMGYRVKKYKLGLTYDQNSLESAFITFIKTPKESYENSIEEYMKSQSSERLESVLTDTFK